MGTEDGIQHMITTKQNCISTLDSKNSTTTQQIIHTSNKQTKNCEHMNSISCGEEFSHNNIEQEHEELDSPCVGVDMQFFKFFTTLHTQQSQMEDIMLAHKIIKSGKCNRWGCRIPVASGWNILKMDFLLQDYEDGDLVEWLTFGFPVSRADDIRDPIPANSNHLGATMFPDQVDAYIEKEIRLGATMGPFSVPPFMNRIGISPLSTRPKRNSAQKRVILDLSFPENASVNFGIKKDEYCGTKIKLEYPTIDTLTRRVAQLGHCCLLWKLDLHRFFRQLPLCPKDYCLIGYRWRNMIFHDKMMPMGLRSAAYVAQKTTCAITFIHKSLGFWSTNYLDDFGSAELPRDAWSSFNAMRRILHAVGADEAHEKAVPPTTRLEFLGNTVDTVKMTIEVSEDRMEELGKLLHVWETRTSYSKKQLQSLIGKLSFITNCVRPGRIFLSRLIGKLSGAKKQQNTVDQEMLKDIKWWNKFLPEYNGVSMLWLHDRWDCDNLLASDVSLIGGGATNMESKQYFHMKFPKEILQQTTNIAQLEMYTLLISVKLWAPELVGKVVRFSTDNQIVMYAVNKGPVQGHVHTEMFKGIGISNSNTSDSDESTVHSKQTQYFARRIIEMVHGVRI